ncbi:conserved hypothetical protein [Echinococcus multilocularis]|uniref:Uncharacterized protein n=1 Tax=Echinococcus multilocularis TaxID=6211 RepID=A0A068Y9Z6_ECHMU|nr:conserved hypothetical protein [Echinococcus multilocularis]
MNFGNFFRNISTDKSSGNRGGTTSSGSAGGGGGGGGRGGGEGGVGGGGSIFAAPSRLFESINAKTESIVSDFSHKVDLANKLDTIKKYSSIDKIGQSVLGTTFQSRPSNQPPDDPTKVPAQTSQNQEDSYSPPSQQTQQRQQQQQQQQQQLQEEEEACQGNRSEQSGAWSANYCNPHSISTPTDISNGTRSLHDFSGHTNQPPHTTSYEYHPRGGYIIRERETQESPKSHPPNRASQHRFGVDNFGRSDVEHNGARMSTEQEATQPTREVVSQGRESFSGSPCGGARANPSEVSAWQTDSRFASQACQLSSGESAEERRHENPFNKGVSVDMGTSRKETASSIMRQNTTPGFRPPRPPPPRSRSGSASESVSGCGSQSLLIESARKVSLTEEVSAKQPSSVLHSITTSVLYEEVDEPLKSAVAPPLSEEIGYLTRLQCQQIVSAVDDMIAEDIDVSHDYETEPYRRQESQSHNYWRDTPRGGSELHDAQTVESRPQEVSTYYVTEPDDTTPSKQATDGTPLSYQPSYVGREEKRLKEGEEGEEGEEGMESEVTEAKEENEVDENAHDYEYEDEEEKKWGREDEVTMETGEGRTGASTDDWHGNYGEEEGRRTEGYPPTSHDVGSKGKVGTPDDSLKPFITEYVQELVTGNEIELNAKNEAFKGYMLTPQGREIFSKVVEVQGAYSGGRLDENGLRALLSRVVFVLTECHKWEDFVPAKRLLTTSLVYHIEDPMKVGEKVFFFSYIKSQPIWHSLRFGNPGFFQSGQGTRAKRMVQMRSDTEIDHAIIGQIRSYLNTMQVFNLHATMRYEFLRKQGDLFIYDVEALSVLIDNPQTN